MNNLAIAVEIGGSHVELGLVRGDTLLASQTIPVSAAYLYQVLPRIQAGIPAIAARCGLQTDQVSGIAVGVCGVVGGNRLTATNGKYDDGVGFNFEEWGRQCFDLPCRAQNDTRMALLGERFAGAARGINDAVLVTLGTGIGAGCADGLNLRKAGKPCGSRHLLMPIRPLTEVRALYHRACGWQSARPRQIAACRFSRALTFGMS